MQVSLGNEKSSAKNFIKIESYRINDVWNVLFLATLTTLFTWTKINLSFSYDLFEFY